MKKELKNTIINFKNFFPRVLYASSYYNSKYQQIVKWGFQSKENTNYTYNLTDKNLLYLANMISIVTNTSFEIIDSYIQEALSDAELAEHVIGKTRDSEFKNFADERCEFGRRVGWYAVARAIKPEIIIETGVDKGHGAVLLCSALLKNSNEGYQGYYYGTDINPTAGYLLDGIYQKQGRILYGDSIASLKKLTCKIDLFINDSDHSAEYEYQEYLTINDKLSANAIILADNAHVTARLAQFSLENKRKFLFFKEEPKNHWYPGAGIGFSF